MRRVLVLVFVLMSMLWQATAVAGPMALARAGEDLAHAALHWQEEGHHHHEDGGYTADGSYESMQHIVADAALGAPFIGATPTAAFPPNGSPSPRMSPEDHLPAPALERLRRPPKRSF